MVPPLQKTFAIGKGFEPEEEEGSKEIISFYYLVRSFVKSFIGVWN
jgi:hypothetical protein